MPSFAKCAQQSRGGQAVSGIPKKIAGLCSSVCVRCTRYGTGGRMRGWVEERRGKNEHATGMGSGFAWCARPSAISQRSNSNGEVVSWWGWEGGWLAAWCCCFAATRSWLYDAIAHLRACVCVCVCEGCWCPGDGSAVKRNGVRALAR